MGTVMILGQPAEVRTGLAGQVFREWPGARGSTGAVVAPTARREYHIDDPPGCESACFRLFREAPRDIAVVVIPVDGLVAGTADLAAVARLRGVGHFVLFVVGTSDEPAWRDLVEADAREALAAVGIPADDLPVADTLTRLFAVLDALEFVPREPARDGPVRLTVDRVYGSAGFLAKVDRGTCRVGDVLELVGPEPRELVTIERIGTHGGDVDTEYAGETAGFSVTPSLDGRIAVGHGLAVAGTLRTVHRFEAVIRRFDHSDRRDPLLAGGEPRFLRTAHWAYAVSFLQRGWGTEFRVRVTDFRRFDGSPTDSCPPGGIVLATCELSAALPLEPGDYFSLCDSTILGDGVVTAVGES